MVFFRGNRLNPPELEARFRQQRLGPDIAQMTLVVAIVMVATTSFALADDHWVGTLLSDVLTVSRVVILVSSVALIVALRRGVTVRTFDVAVFLWLMLVAGDLVLVNATRPDTPAVSAVLDVMAIVALYVVVPAPLPSQLVPSLFATLGYGLLLMKSGVMPEPDAAVVILASFAMANAFGWMGSRQAHRTSRQQFVALLHEREAREALERAIAEIKTLRGIIPICSHCGRVRSDSGYWERVEAYVGRHTDANFSHGICPDCVDGFYADLMVEPG